jgi:hypothetical protein
LQPVSTCIFYSKFVGELKLLLNCDKKYISIVNSDWEGWFKFWNSVNVYFTSWRTWNSQYSKVLLHFRPSSNHYYYSSTIIIIFLVLKTKCLQKVVILRQQQVWLQRKHFHLVILNFLITITIKNLPFNAETIFNIKFHILKNKIWILFLKRCEK